MSDRSDSRTARRQLLKLLSVSGAVVGSTPMLPTQWTKPIVDQVLLPAHGQTSPAEDSGNNTPTPSCAECLSGGLIIALGWSQFTPVNLDLFVLPPGGGEVGPGDRGDCIVHTSTEGTTQSGGEFVVSRFQGSFSVGNYTVVIRNNSGSAANATVSIQNCGNSGNQFGTSIGPNQTLNFLEFSISAGGSVSF